MIIGLTGGIGVGKSVVGAMLSKLGAHVIDTDKVGHRVYAPGSGGWRQIVDAFGQDVVAADGTIDRVKLGAVVFGNDDKRRVLNAIVHPLIFAEIVREMNDRRAAGFAGHFVLEAPVLVEAKGTGIVDRVWVVTAPRRTIDTRLGTSRNMTQAEVEARMAAQLSDEERRKHADLVIENDGDLAALRAKVEAAWRTLPNPPTKGGAS